MTRNATESNNVVHPAHYNAGGIECIDAIAAALDSQKDPMQAWLTGTIFKYLWRWPLKNGREDLEKAQFYLRWLIEFLPEAKDEKTERGENEMDAVMNSVAIFGAGFGIGVAVAALYAWNKITRR